jgi:hypothetical protein
VLVLGRVAAAVLLPLATGASAGGDVAFSFDDARIAESSGLVALADGTFVTTNDSGDVGRVFVVSGTGKTVRVAQWSSKAVDQEAVAPSRHADRVWVGDTGDNGASRSGIVLSEVGVGAANAGVRYRTISAAYPDRAHDAETLMLAPDGRLLIATKGFLGGTLYAVPASAMSGSSSGTVTLEQISSSNAVLAMATDGAFFPDGRHFLVRGYVSATLYAWPSLERLGAMPLPTQRQGEGLAIDAEGTLWLTSEGVHSKVLHIAPSERLAALMAPSPSPSGSATASPTGGASSTPEPVAEADDSDSATGSDRWPWIAAGAIGLGLVAYLVRALGRRR